MLLVLCISATMVVSETPEPEPYDPSEFPQWALDVRRGSVIAFGSLPVTLLVSRIVYDVGRFSMKSIEAGTPDAAYAPLFFAPSDGIPLSDSDRHRILAIGIGSAVVVALVDYYLGRQERK